MPWGPKTLKTSEVSRPVPSPHTVSPASQSGLGTARLFRDHPGHEHSRQCSGRTAHLPVLPCIPLGSACALPLAPASCGCFPLSCTGRSVTSPRPFTCVPGRAVAPLRCTHRRKLVLSPKRTLPEEVHTVFLSSLLFLLLRSYFCIQRACGFLR